MNTENIKEEVTTNVDAVTVGIPVRVTMTSINNAPFEFTPSIDEVGQIVLTPNSKDVEFIDANTDHNVEYEKPVIEQEDVTTVEDNFTTKETSIVITANMLVEKENIGFSAIVDEIGQVVIYPLAKENIFVTASVNNSLNLVTEDLKVVEYFGYKLMNNGDGWDIWNQEGELVETGVATENGARIIVCQTELHRLQGLTEEVNFSEASELTDEQEETSPEIEAEVIEESIQFANDVLINITDDFTQEEGAVSCDTEEELSECKNILSCHYANVYVTTHDNKQVICYADLKH